MLRYAILPRRQYHSTGPTFIMKTSLLPAECCASPAWKSFQHRLTVTKRIPLSIGAPGFGSTPRPAGGRRSPAGVSPACMSRYLKGRGQGMSYRIRSGAGRDPYRLTAKYAGTCAKCGGSFSVGDSIFYYPNGRKAYSGKCADEAQADFRSCASDEAFYNGSAS